MQREGTGARVYELRRALNMRQVQLAQMSELSQATISRIERGQHKPDADALKRIAKALRVPARKLVDQ